MSSEGLISDPVDNIALESISDTTASLASIYVVQSLGSVSGSQILLPTGSPNFFMLNENQVNALETRILTIDNLIESEPIIPGEFLTLDKSQTELLEDLFAWVGSPIVKSIISVNEVSHGLTASVRLGRSYHNKIYKNRSVHAGFLPAYLTAHQSVNYRRRNARSRHAIRAVERYSKDFEHKHDYGLLKSNKKPIGAWIYNRFRPVSGIQA